MAEGLRFAERSIEDLMRASVVVDAFSGSATATVPLPMSPGRSDVQPNLAVVYRSGAPNSPIGVSWSLEGLGVIALDTQRGVPRYDGRDPYIASGYGELVAHRDDVAGQWTARVASMAGYRVETFRPTPVVGPVRLERWTRDVDGSVHWRVREAGGEVSIYGRAADGSTRVADPNRPERVSQWLLEATYDMHGNAIRYEYLAEDLTGITTRDSAEVGRVIAGVAPAQRYVKRILYNNTWPLSPDGADPAGNRFAVVVVFDYGDHSDPTAGPAADRAWPVRPDAFSSCRAGFEVRTYRQLQRVLRYHDFAELGPAPTLVGSVRLDHDDDPAGSALVALQAAGYRRLADGTMSSRAEPPIRFSYGRASPATSFTTASAGAIENAPRGLSAARTSWADVFGDGLAGVLTETDTAWWFKRNLGGGVLGPSAPVVSRPAGRNGMFTLGDFDRDGNPELVVVDGRGAGCSRYDRDRGAWQAFEPFDSAPHVEGGAARDWVDLNADGLPDIVVTKPDRVTWYPSIGRAGFGPPVDIERPASSSAPALGEHPDVGLLFADMSGDGLTDLVEVGNGRVTYAPHLGNGRLGDTVVMEGAPCFDHPDDFDHRRLRFVDLDGSGTSDLVYVGAGEIRWWANACGNRLIEGEPITGLPYIDAHAPLQVLDFLGDGTPTLVWSSWLPGDDAATIRYLPLHDAHRPRLLTEVDNSMGAVMRLRYGWSASHYLRDRAAGRDWRDVLPVHHVVVETLEVEDLVRHATYRNRFEYHDGRYDGDERRFVGFGLVDRYDTAPIDPSTPASPDDRTTTPSCVRTWFHTGGAPRPRAAAARDHRYRAGLPEADLDQSGPETPTGMTTNDLAAAQRALAGRTVREETFAVGTGGAGVAHPLVVTEHRHGARMVQPGTGDDPAVFMVYEAESLTATYEGDPVDPRIEHHLVLRVDDDGTATHNASVCLPRRGAAALPGQQQLLATFDVLGYASRDGPGDFLAEVALEASSYELAHAAPANGRRFRLGELAAVVDAALAAPLAFDQPFAPAAAAPAPQARRRSWTRQRYWNDARNAALPFGSIGRRMLIHHNETACFTPGLVTDVYGPRVDAPALRAAGYASSDGHWWRIDPTIEYTSARHFDLPAAERHTDGTQARTLYDGYDLNVVREVDRAGNAVSAASLDRYVVAADGITDTNGNTAQVAYDELGFIVAEAVVATVAAPDGTARAYGTDALDQWTRRSDASMATVVANPLRYLQRAGLFSVWELDTWSAPSPRPPCRARVMRVALVNDGLGVREPAGPVEIDVTHFDGHGRVVQAKQEVEPGDAIRRGADGAVLTGADGMPLVGPAARRWRTAGHIALDARRQPVRENEPYFSPSPDYDDDDVLHSLGHSTVSCYDALGRLVAREYPNGTLERVEHHAWEVVTHDTIDTLQGSLYEIQRAALPPSSPQRHALDQALVHVGTPTRLDLRGDGRPVREVRSAAGGVEVVTERVDDVDGSPLRLVDERGLTAARFRYDMAGRQLSCASIDAGTRRQLPDTADQVVREWDGANTETATDYDGLGRLAERRVTRAGAATKVVERCTYGDAPGVTNQARRNVRGRLVRHDDPAGRTDFAAYTPDGQPLRHSMSLRVAYRAEPDWSDPAEAVEATQYASAYRYDATGRVVEFVAPDASTRRTRYARGGGSARVHLRTAAGEVDDDLISRTDSDAYGRTTLLERGGFLTTHVAYDAEERRVASVQSVVSSPVGARRTVQDLHYVADPAGNVTSVLDNAQEPAGGATTLLRGLTVTSRRDFTYDAHGRLLRATGRIHQALQRNDALGPDAPGVVAGTRHLHPNNGAVVERYTQTFRYDDAGNLLQLRVSSPSASWTDDVWVSQTSNRRLPAKTPAGGAVTLGDTRFDANGNASWLPHVASIEWSATDRLSSVVFVDRSATHGRDDAEYYTYDAYGRRVRKVLERVVAGGVEVTDVRYLDGCEVTRVMRGGVVTLERHTARITDADRAIAVVHRWVTDTTGRETDDTTKAVVRYQLADHLASVVLELDAHGDLIDYEESFPYGGPAFAAATDERLLRTKRYRFVGRERDAATGLYYFEHRYYAPWIGAWLSPDPLGPQDDLNLYTYTRDNPVTLVDPEGLQPQTTTIGRTSATTEAQAIADFNRTYALRAGAIATSAVSDRQGGTLNWTITGFRELPPPIAQLRDRYMYEPGTQPTAEQRTGLEVAQTLLDIEGILRDVADRDPGVEAATTATDTPPAGNTDRTSGSGGGEDARSTVPTAKDPPAQTNQGRGTGKEVKGAGSAPHTSERPPGGERPARRADKQVMRTPARRPATLVTAPSTTGAPPGSGAQTGQGTVAAPPSSVPESPNATAPSPTLTPQPTALPGTPNEIGAPQAAAAASAPTTPSTATDGRGGPDGAAFDPRATHPATPPPKPDPPPYEEGAIESIFSGRSEPGFGKSLIPVVGSMQSANYHLSHDNYVRGVLYTILAATDVFLVRSIVMGLGKIAWKGFARVTVSLPVLVEAIVKEAQFWKGVGSQTSLALKASRFFVQLKATYDRTASIVGRILNAGIKFDGKAMFEFHHWLIQKKWFDTTKFVKSEWIRQGLQYVGNAGWNLIPLPAPINNALGKSMLATGALAGHIGVTLYRELEFAYENLTALPVNVEDTRQAW